MNILLSHDSNTLQNQVLVIRTPEALTQLSLTEGERNYVLSKLEGKAELVALNRYGSWLFIFYSGELSHRDERAEVCRRKGNELIAKLRSEKITELEIVGVDAAKADLLAFAEGVALGGYTFSKYFTKKSELSNYPAQIKLTHSELDIEEVNRLEAMVQSVYWVRDLVNEPVLTLNAEALAAAFVSKGSEAGFGVEVLHKSQIEALKMGGLLAVNKGSIDPPTFSILEWKPDNALNSQPVVLVGKGVVFDTGGLSLKPTPQSMDSMKCDMAGAAAVAGALCYAAITKLPLHIIALVPATDNRPDGNAITPGDVITMHNGTTVEVLNTDAEGRLLLADALSFASRYQPGLVIDVATLTGAAAMALGSQGIVGMGTAAETTITQLRQAGSEVYERVVEFPLWDEYNDLIKSDIADVKNIGGREAGAITAGKFLQRFVAYPWVHLDIAGPSFLSAADHYRPKGGTAVGVRLLSRFLEMLCQDKGN